MTASIRRSAAWTFVATLALYVLTAGGSLTSTDAVVTYELTRSLVLRGAVDVPPGTAGSGGRPGTDGRYYSQFGLGQAIYNIPFFTIGRLVAEHLPRPVGKPDTILKAAVAIGSAVAAAVAVTALYVLSWLVTGSGRAAVLSAASVAIGSPLWPYSKFGVSAALTAALLALCACLCWRAAAEGRRGSEAAAGGVMAFAWLTRHETVVLLVPFAVFLWMARDHHAGRRSTPWMFLVVSVTGGVAWMIYNALRFGSPFDSGYRPEWDGQGYAAFLIAPGGALLLYCPVLLVWTAGLRHLARAERHTLLLLGAPLVASYLFYGALVDWPGGRSYGPRYLVPTLVLLAPGLAIAHRAGAIRTRAAVGVIALATVLQLPGVLVDYAKVSQAWAQTATPTEVRQRNWRLASSPFVLNARAALDAVPANVEYVTGRRPRPVVRGPSGAADREFSQQFAFSLDFWWLYLLYAGAIGPRTAVVLAGSLVLVTLLAAWRSIATSSAASK